MQARIQKDVEGGPKSDELPSIRGFAYLPGGARPSPPALYPRLHPLHRNKTAYLSRAETKLLTACSE